MKFGQHFESLKIPEWTSMYLDYELLKKFISRHKAALRRQQVVKLRGNYRFAQDCCDNRWRICRDHEDFKISQDCDDPNLAVFGGGATDIKIKSNKTFFDKDASQPLISKNKKAETAAVTRSFTVHLHKEMDNLSRVSASVLQEEYKEQDALFHGVLDIKAQDTQIILPAASNDMTDMEVRTGRSQSFSQRDSQKLLDAPDLTEEAKSRVSAAKRSNITSAITKVDAADKINKTTVKASAAVAQTSQELAAEVNMNEWILEFVREIDTSITSSSTS